MSKNQKEKICAFYASDYHFEMISLPYIEKNIEQNKKIIVLTENDLEESMETLVSKINLDNNKKSNILNINWKNDDINKFKTIKENKDDDMIIFVKGKENYIKNINKNIDKWLNDDNKIKIIDCYDIGEVSDNMINVTAKYKKVLSTRGERDIGI